MVNPFNAYKKFPFRIPFRVQFFNLFRIIFTIPIFERLLVSNLHKQGKFWARLVPPLYFYEHGSIRHATRDGINYQLDISRLIDHSIFFYKINEASWKNLFTFLQKDFTVLDIGANMGFLTMNFARSCSEGFIFSFEPDSENFKNLLQNIAKNNLKNITPLKKALGAKEESATLYKLYSNNPGANRILPADSVAMQANPCETVEITTLDNMVEKLSIERIDLIKIDVEGFEMFVLYGGQQSIRKWNPILFVELAEVNLRLHGYSALSLIEFVESLGYEIKDARTMQSVDRSKNDHHTDILCFPKKLRS